MAVAVLMTGIGRLVTPRMIPEIKLLAGWGVLCLVLTFWGCATVTTLAIPTSILGVLGLLGLLKRDPGGQDPGGLWRVGLLSVPIWLVMIPVGPSQVDTWLNLLPNAAYLTDHGFLPRADRPESYSFIPVAPYNTQFVNYAASLIRGGLVPNAMGLFNILLQCAAGGILARLVSGGERRLTWTDAALGLLLAIPLNPGFLPRAFFAPYGEAPIAVTAMAAVWLGGTLLGSASDPSRRRELLTALGLILAAMVNIKQSAIGLVLSIEAGAVLLVMVRQRSCDYRLADLLHLVPALALYVVWRWYAETSFTIGELKALPVSQWNTALIPQILAGVAKQIAARGFYFAVILVFLAGTVAAVRRGVSGAMAMILVLGAATILFDNGFIIFTYIAHFDPASAVDAHSYFRYMSQLSLIVMLGLTLLYREPVIAWALARNHRTRTRLAAASAAAIILAPFAAIHYLRFDLAAPQPEMLRMAGAVKERLKPGERLAVLVPGDFNDIAGSYLRGILLYEEPRLIPSSIRTAVTADPATLASLAAAGYHRALLSCSSHAQGIPGLPGGAMVLLAQDGGAWHGIAAWPYPPGFGATHWAALLPKASFCGDLVRGQS